MMTIADMSTRAVERTLICTPVGRDAQLLLEMLNRENIQAESYQNLEELACSFDPAVDALIVLAEEALLPRGVKSLYERLRQQPAWSEVPIILFTTTGHRVSELGTRLVELFDGEGNITMLERPLRTQTLLSTVHSTLRARRRQYQVCDLLVKRERDAAMLREANEALEQRVQDRTSELSKANAELQREVEERTRAESVLRQLSQRVVQMQDVERRRIARELHDSVGQYLAAIAMNVTALEERVSPELQPRVKEILKELDTCIKDVRTISHLLHPPLLDEIGLSSALEWYVGEFAKRGRIRVALQMPPELRRMKPDTETAVFRIVQEALTNIYRHSGAQKASISIESDANRLRIRVSDDGRGISPDILARIAAGQSGVGVTGMSERVRLLGGRFHIDSNHSGTTLQVDLPLYDDQAGAT
jgi:signal transduction histidine kinase